MGMPVKKAKEHCGYEAKPVFNTCGNCGAFASDMELPAWMQKKNTDWDGTEYTVEKHGIEKNMRCSDHGFATKKLATCNLWRAKIVTPNVQHEGPARASCSGPLDAVVGRQTEE